VDYEERVDKEAQAKYLLGSYAILYVLYPERKEERFKLLNKIKVFKAEGLITDDDVKRAIRFIAKLKEEAEKKKR